MSNRSAGHTGIASRLVFVTPPVLHSQRLQQVNGDVPTPHSHSLSFYRLSDFAVRYASLSNLSNEVHYALNNGQNVGHWRF